MPFSKFPLHADLLKAIKELGFQRPTPIQEQAIPPAAAGKDVLASAMTGSGKTAAFLLPILERLRNKPRRQTRALILTPTRELAAQIHVHLEELAVHTSMTGAPVFGGVGMGPQEHAFRSGVDIIVATPGRLLDHLRFNYAKLSGLEVLVLDEADRMLDMGFLPDIKRILRLIPTRRQTLFFSATMPPGIAGLAREMLHDPVTINLERKSAPPVGITQAAYPVRHDLKSALLATLLERKIIADAIVFTRTKHRANRLADYLERQGISTARIHGNRSQAQRTAALNGFKAGRHRVLVATDIVARGIDVEALGHVVNFDVPEDPDAYIHRIGRTARAETTGDAFTFVAPDEESDLRAIERVLGHALPRVSLPDFDYAKKATERLEIPLRERLATARAARGPRKGTGQSGERGHGLTHGKRPAAPHRGPAAAQRQSRFEEILDRHAPARPGGTRPPAPSGPRPSDSRRDHTPDRRGPSPAGHASAPGYNRPSRPHAPSGPRRRTR
jgi:ATP-dependent RNA helicase RhlE